MLKVLHVITGVNTGGAEVALLRLLTNEDSSQFRSEVFSLVGDGPIGVRMRKAGIVTLNCGGPCPNITRSMFALLRHCVGNRPDVIQGWMYHGNLAATLAATVARVPVHGWNVRCSLPDLTRERRRNVASIRAGATLSAVPRWIIYNSRRALGQHVALGYSASRAIYLPNGFDCEQLEPRAEVRSRLRAQHGFSDSDLVVGIAARYHRLKDYPSFVRTAALVSSRFSEARFVAIGRDVDWSNETLRRSIESEGLRERFRLLGERPQSEHCASMFDVNVLSSIAEGFPNAVAEGMAYGVPTVGTDVGDTAWIIGNGGTTVPPSDPEALAAAICELLAMTASGRQAVGALARLRIITEFSMQRNIDTYARLFNGLSYARGAVTTNATQD